MAKNINHMKFLVGMEAGATTPFLPPVNFGQKRRPNVLFLLMDDMIYKSIGRLAITRNASPQI